MKTFEEKIVKTNAEIALAKIEEAIYELNGMLFSEEKHKSNVHRIYGLKGGNTIILVEYRNHRGELNGCDVYYPSQKMKTDDLIAELKKFAEQ